MYRYDHYYGHWLSDSDESGDEDGRGSGTTGGGDGGGGGTDPPDPGPVILPQEPAVLAAQTPAVITTTEATDFGGAARGYIPAGQFTQSRCFPIQFGTWIRQGVQNDVVLLNARPEYSYTGPLADESYRFPYYVPGNANLDDLSALPAPVLDLSYVFTQNSGSPQKTGTWTFRTTYNGVNHDQTVEVATDPANPAYRLVNLTPIVFDKSQIKGFVRGRFNSFTFQMIWSNPTWVDTIDGKGLTFLFKGIQTSMPSGYNFELVLAKNFTSRLGINVVSSTDRTLISGGSGTTSSTGPIRDYNAPNGASTYRAGTYTRYQYPTGYNYWEMPVATVLPHNRKFKMTLMGVPDNQFDCSMEPSPKLPGPNPPWNLLSNHETWSNAFHWMRESDFPMFISDNPYFYFGKDWRGLIYLKQGIANNDVLPGPAAD